MRRQAPQARLPYLIGISFLFFISGTIFSQSIVKRTSFNSAPFTFTSSATVNDLINNSKTFFKKNGILINWSELSRLSPQKQIYNLAMISPISAEEKQKLIEIVKLDDVANILNEITKFNFYENSEKKKILQ